MAYDAAVFLPDNWAPFTALTRANASLADVASYVATFGWDVAHTQDTSADPVYLRSTFTSRTGEQAYVKTRSYSAAQWSSFSTQALRDDKVRINAVDGFNDIWDGTNIRVRRRG